MTSSNEALRKRVEVVLDMAITTVSSLTESFISGVPVLLGDEVGVVKEKDEVRMEEVGENSNVGGSGLAKDTEMSNGNAEESDGEEEDEFGVLQVHD